MLDQQKEIQKKIQMHINSQSFFKSEKSRRDLLLSDCETIRRCRKNWESGVNIPEARSEIRSGIIRVLRNLERLKADYEGGSRMLAAMQKDSSLNVHDLLTIMFHTVFHAMYREEWGDIGDEKAVKSELREIRREFFATDTAEEPGADFFHEATVSCERAVTEEETVSYEKTVSYEDKPVWEETL
ncbi:MAG: hypothetical protein R2941_04460 [Desulfobacterales bacterium]